MKITFTVTDQMADALEKQAADRMLPIQEAVRSLLAEHLTGRCVSAHPLQAPAPPGPVPAPSAVTPAPAVTPAKMKPKDHEAMMREMSDIELTEHLKEIGFFHKDGTHTIVQPSDPCPPDGRWWKHIIITSGDQKSHWRLSMNKDGTEEKDNRYRESEKTDELMAAIKRKGKL